MRLRITLNNPHETRLTINYQHFLTAAVYRLLGTSDADYAHFLHDEGYGLGDGPKRFKLFVFSGLRAPSHRRRVAGDTLWLAPGPVVWFVASPMSDFLLHSATGLLAVGDSLHVGPAAFTVAQIETLAMPAFGASTAFTCLSPIVASVSLPDGGTQYLRPEEGDAFSEAVRRNLLRKYEVLHGGPPADAHFSMTFDPGYLRRSPGTKLVQYKNIQIRGAFCPFVASGSADLRRVLWESGAGEKNSFGFGMVDLAGRDN